MMLGAPFPLERSRRLCRADGLHVGAPTGTRGDRARAASFRFAPPRGTSWTNIRDGMKYGGWSLGAGQQAYYHRAKCNGAARSGSWTDAMEDAA